jgi:heavy metal efflux system protein
MAFNISFAMVVSLVLTLTLIPVLAAVILKPKEERALYSWASSSGYLPLLLWSLVHKKIVAGAALILLAASLALYPLLGKEFMPQLQEGVITWRVTSIPSTSLDKSIQIYERIERALNKFPEVGTTVAIIGRAKKGETADVSYMEIYTDLKPPDQWPGGLSIEQLTKAMREKFGKSGAHLVDRLYPAYPDAGGRTYIRRARNLACNLYGEDLGELDRLSE